MKTCEHCGAQNPDTAKFCRSCGQRFAAAPDAVTAAAPSAAPSAEPSAATDAAPAADTAAAAETTPVDSAAPAGPAAGDGPQPDATQPMPAAPTQAIPVQDASAPAQSAPTQPMPAPGQPVQPAPVQPTPAPAMQPPVQPAPVRPTGQPAPGQQAPGQQAPAPGQPMPGQPAPGQPVPGQSAPAAGGWAAPGQPMPGQPAPGAYPMPGQPAAAPHPASPTSANAFFRWVWESFLHPSAHRAVPVWWPIIPMVVNSLIMGLTVYMWQVRAVSAVSSYGNHLLSTLSGGYYSYSSPGVSVAEFFKAWFGLTAFLYLTVLMCLMGVKLLGDARATFSGLHTQLAQKFMPLMALNLLALLCALIGDGMTALSVVLFVIGILFLVVTPGAIIAQAPNHRKLDKTWMWIFAVLLCGVILFVFVAILSAIGLVGALSSLSSLM